MTIENVGFPVREPMLASGQVDAITGFSFSSFINLKANGVPVDDIAVMLMADYGVDLYGNTIIVSPAFAEAHPDAVKGFLKALNKAIKETIADPEAAIEYVVAANADRRQGDRTRAAEDGARPERGDRRGQGERPRRGRHGPARQGDRPDRPDLRIRVKPTAEATFDPSFLPDAGGRGWSK